MGEKEGNRLLLRQLRIVIDGPAGRGERERFAACALTFAREADTESKKALLEFPRGGAGLGEALGAEALELSEMGRDLLQELCRRGVAGEEIEKWSCGEELWGAGGRGALRDMESDMRWGLIDRARQLGSFGEWMEASAPAGKEWERLREGLRRELRRNAWEEMSRRLCDLCLGWASERGLHGAAASPGGSRLERVDDWEDCRRALQRYQSEREAFEIGRGTPPAEARAKARGI